VSGGGNETAPLTAAVPTGWRARLDLRPNALRLRDSAIAIVQITVAATEGEVPLARLLVDRGLAASRKEAERLITQGAVSLEGEKVSDPSFRMALKASMRLLVKVGKLKLERWVVR